MSSAPIISKSPYLIVTLFAIFLTVLYIQETNALLAQIPFDLDCLKHTETLARLFIAVNVAALVIRNGKSISEIKFRSVIALVCAGLVYWASLPFLNWSVDQFSPGIKFQAIAASLIAEKAPKTIQDPLINIGEIPGYWKTGRAEDVDRLWKLQIKENISHAIGSREKELLQAYHDIGKFMKRHWEWQQEMYRTGNRGLGWKTSVDMQKSNWTEEPIRRYCNTNLAPPGAAAISPCDFPLWLSDQEFLYQIAMRQKEAIPSSHCTIPSCPLLDQPIARDAMKALLLPPVVYVGARLVLILHILFFMVCVFRGVGTSRRTMPDKF